MRLTDYQLTTIKNSFTHNFGGQDHLWLFGSRVDDTKRGGDIDLYIETFYDVDQAVNKELKFFSDLQLKLGEQKIDIILKLLNSDFEMPIYRTAKNTGIKLV